MTLSRMFVGYTGYNIVHICTYIFLTDYPKHFNNDEYWYYTKPI